MKYIIFFLITFSFAQASTEVSNGDQLRQKFGLTSYTNSPASLKIAVLDNGFLGYAPNQGLLPASTQLIEGPVDPEAQTSHGLGMAQIVWAMTGKNPAGPQFYLVNTNGFSDFKAAIDYVIAQNVDIVLYSQVWPFGDNFDGQGFINAQVNRATSAGILWINAAGNFGSLVYNGSIQENATDHLLTYNNGFNYLRFQNNLDSNPVTITLTWNDFQDTEAYNSKKDLDLFVYDSTGKQVGASQLVQSGVAPAADGSTPTLSSYARETVTLPNLDRGNYQIKVLDKSHNFVSSDLFRVLISVDNPDSLTFTDHTAGQEIMPPADNPNVFTVGEQTSASSVGPTVDGRIKPDATIDDATISFTNGVTTRGSSNAAAIMTGIVAEIKASNPILNLQDLSSYANGLRSDSGTNTSDLQPINTSLVNSGILALVPADGSIMIETNGHLVILCPEDPLSLPVFQNYGAYRFKPDDILTVNVLANAWHVSPSSSESLIVAPWVEFRQMKTGGTWVTPGPNFSYAL
jgi:hypothetical protein